MDHGTRVVYLVRHAHAEWSLDEMRPLSSQGTKAAEVLADHLAVFPITHIATSGARRARQTIAPLAVRLGLRIMLEPDLRERRLIAPELSAEAWRDALAFRDAVKATWRDPQAAHPGGETNATAQARGVAVLQRLMRAHPDGHLVLSTHGNLLTLILQHFVPSIGFEFWSTLTMPDVVVLTIDGAGHAELDRQGWWDSAM